MATTYDIAKIVGVHQSTVSRVLGKQQKSVRISDQTREKILKVASELNFQPNFAARSLATASVQTIGVCVFPQETVGPNLLGDYYLPHLVDGIQRYLYPLEYDILIVAARQPDKDLSHLKKLIYQNRVDALILLSVLEETKDLHHIAQTGCPIVLVNSPVSLPGTFRINIHNHQAAVMATEYLISLGHHRIGFLGYMKDKEPHYETERRRGYESAMLKHGIQPRAEWIITSSSCPEKVPCVGDWGYVCGYRGMKRLLGQDPTLTAVFCVTDLAAAGALACLADEGISVPDQFSVVGFDNSIAPLLHPPLTTVNHEFERMGYLAAQKALELARQGGQLPFEQNSSPDLFVSLSLVVRKSTGICKS